MPVRRVARLARHTVLLFVLLGASCSNPDAKRTDDPSPDSGGALDQTSQNNSTQTSIHASDFEQGCAVDTECVLVGDGDVCTCAPCEATAIHQTALDDYTATRDALDCPNDVDPLIRCETACPSRMAVCASQTCGAREPTIIDASVYRQDCETPDDCIVIATGEVCSPCRCGAAAIHLDDLPSYQADSNVDCAPDPTVACNCEPGTIADCVDELCVVLAPR